MPLAPAPVPIPAPAHRLEMTKETNRLGPAVQTLARINIMSSPPSVSVVIPCFNAAEDLEHAVQSVLDQNVPKAEILIVDDGSTDGSVAVAEQLARQHASIQILRQAANGGPAAARNKGLRKASGRYVCFLDADDAYAPGFSLAWCRSWNGTPSWQGS